MENQKLAASKAAKEKLKSIRNPIKMQLEIISPTMATEWLRTNTDRQRHINQRLVTFLAEQIRKRQWQLTHQGLAFDTKGHLIDGQHRLHAIAKSGKTVEMLVFRNLDPKVFDILDSGKNRTARDILQTAGLADHATSKAISARMILAYKHGGLMVKERSMISNRMMLKFVEKNDDELIALASKFASLKSKYPGIMPDSHAIAFSYIFARLKDCDYMTAVSFFERIYTGADLPETSAELFFRNWCVRDKQHERRATMRLRFYMTISAWNSFRRNEVMTRQWTYRDDHFPEPF